MSGGMGASSSDEPEVAEASEPDHEPITQSKTLALASFLIEMGAYDDFDCVVKIFGTDSLDDIIGGFTDIGDFNPLVQAGMKPIHKNKLYRALSVERRKRAMTELAAFLVDLGSEFSADFVSNTLGTVCLEEIISRHTNIEDFDSLIRAGMKPLHRNKLRRARDGWLLSVALVHPAAFMFTDLRICRRCTVSSVPSLAKMPLRMVALMCVQ